jgi:putative transposase
MSLWRLYYHLVWGTKERRSLIYADREEKLYHYIINKADSISSIVHALGGVEDHIHLIVSIPPHLSVADFVKTIKGSSAYYLNQTFSLGNDKFQWQEGYGVFYLGGKQLEQAVNYVKNQKSHHAEGTIIPSLERFDRLNNPPERWNT